MNRPWFALLGCLLVPYAQAQDLRVPDPRIPPHIVVPSTATAEVVPDVAVLRLGVATERRTATEASAANARSAQALLDELTALGVEARDVRTLSVTLMPVYNEERDANGRTTKRTVTGYRARNAVQVRVRDVGKAGAVARALVERGANVLEGVGFEISDRAARLDTLRAEAIREAGRRAKLYVEALGLSLGRVLEISPEGAPPEDRPMASMAPLRGMEDGAGGAIPLAPGAETLEARARVVWEIAQ